jgi:serine/threonine-protein kinase RsbW
MAADDWNVLVEQSIPSDALAGRAVMERLLCELEAVDWIQEELFGVHLAVEEAIVNAIRHGNREDASKQVRVCCRLAKDRLLIEVEDEGEGFVPEEVPDCTEDENLEVPSGRGIMLMRSFMTRVEYNEQGNRVIMEKIRINGTPRIAD